MENRTYKRTSRHQSPETRQKISEALKGRPKSSIHRLRISRSMERYWGNDANFPDDRESTPDTLYS